MVSVSAKYIGSGIASENWVVIEQEEIPQSQQICTVEDMRNMLDQAMLGQSAKSYISDNCPVKRRNQDGKVIISYDATIFIHRSKGLTNQNYDLIPSEGVLSGGETVHREINRPYKLDREALVFLGWLPVLRPRVSWLTKVFDNDRNRVFVPDIPDSINGYLYFDESYKAELEVDGLGEMDVYTLTIDHQQGYAFDRTILLTAEWGVEDQQGNRESTQLEVKLPQCWIDEASKCGDGQGNWNFQLNAGYWRVYVGFCSGDIKRTTKVI